MTLDNKLGLTDSLELAKMEEKISKTRAKELFEEQLLDDKAAGTYATLAFIHTFLFEKSMTLLVRFGQSISPKGMFALLLSCICQLPWKISTACLSRPLIRLSKSMWSSILPTLSVRGMAGA